MQANAKRERVSTKKLNDVISSQNQFSDKFGLGYTKESNSSGNVTKEVKFVKAKEPIEVAPTVEKPMIERKKNVADQWMLNKPRNQVRVRIYWRKQLIGQCHQRSEVCKG